MAATPREACGGADGADGEQRFAADAVDHRHGEHR